MLNKRKAGDKVQVTFSLPFQEGEEAVDLVGDFNAWTGQVTPMTPKEGQWEVELSLDPECQYQYRYRVNGSGWRNDPAADGYAPNEFGSDNCVVSTVGAP